MTNLKNVRPGATPTRIGVCMMFAMLHDHPTSMKELVEVSGMAESTVRRWMRAARRTIPRAVHIADWDNNVTPLYKLGSRPDAKRRKKTSAQRARECRARKRKLAMLREGNVIGLMLQ